MVFVPLLSWTADDKGSVGELGRLGMRGFDRVDNVLLELTLAVRPSLYGPLFVLLGTVNAVPARHILASTALPSTRWLFGRSLARLSRPNPKPQTLNHQPQPLDLNP